MQKSSIERIKFLEMMDKGEVWKKSKKEVLSKSRKKGTLNKCITKNNRYTIVVISLDNRGWLPVSQLVQQ